MEIISRRSSDFLPKAEIWHVRSAHTGRIHRICACAPELPHAQRDGLGVVYATDSEWLAGVITSLARSMALSGELPPLHVIAIGYPLDVHPMHLVNRTRDLTPSARLDLDRHSAALVGSDERVASGGSGAFLRFVHEELRPCFEAEYCLNSDNATIAGHSLGGLVALQALWEQPGAFRNTLAVSPALWWDDGLAHNRAAASIATIAAPDGAVYLCAGEHEGRAQMNALFDAMPGHVRTEIPPAVRAVDMPSDMRKMAARLAAWGPSRLVVTTEILAGESHNSILGAGFARGLRVLLGTDQLNIRPSREGARHA